jgi:hypothetical protein
MGRILLLSALLYGTGDPVFDGRRPAALDRPLREFHRSVDTAVSDLRRAAVMLDKLHSIPDLAATLRRLNAAF